MIRLALITLLATTPALAQEASDCGACTELDRATMAEPVAPQNMPALPKTPTPPWRGRAYDPGLIGIAAPTIFYRPGSGFWVSDATPGGVFISPKKNKFSVNLRF